MVCEAVDTAVACSYLTKCCGLDDFPAQVNEVVVTLFALFNGLAHTGY